MGECNYMNHPLQRNREIYVQLMVCKTYSKYSYGYIRAHSFISLFVGICKSSALNPFKLKIANISYRQHPSQHEPTSIIEIRKMLTYYRPSWDFNILFSINNMKDLCDMLKLNSVQFEYMFQTVNLPNNPLWLTIFVKQSWNRLWHEINSAKIDLLKTGTIISSSKISVQID